MGSVWRDVGSYGVVRVGGSCGCVLSASSSCCCVGGVCCDLGSCGCVLSASGVM